MAGFEHALLVAGAIALAGAVVAAVLIRPARHGARGRAPRGARRGAVSGTRRLPADARRRAIVLAALRVFSEGSYSGATTSEIAREAGITEPVLYRHFASKRDLWFACLDAAWEEYRTVLDGVLAALVAGGAPATPPPVARWKKALMSNLWIQGITEAGEDREIRRFVARHMRAVHDHIAGWIREQQALGRCRPTATPTPRRGSWSAAPCSARSRTGWAGCSTTTTSRPSSGSGRGGCRERPTPRQRSRRPHAEPAGGEPIGRERRILERMRWVVIGLLAALVAAPSSPARRPTPSTRRSGSSASGRRG